MNVKPGLTRVQFELADSLRLVVGRLARRLRQQSLGGLTLSQRSVLVTLETSGPLRMGELARLENVSPPSITGIVGRLEMRGLVTRVPDPEDARSTMVVIAPEAVEGLVESRRLRSAYLAERIGRLSDQDRETLAAGVEILNRITDE